MALPWWSRRKKGEENAGKRDGKVKRKRRLCRICFDFRNTGPAPCTVCAAVRVAQWIRRLPTKQKIPGSSPGMDFYYFFPSFFFSKPNVRWSAGPPVISLFPVRKRNDRRMLALWVLQSRYGDKPLEFQVVRPQNGNAVLKDKDADYTVRGDHSKWDQTLLLIVKIGKYQYRTW